ncbi:VWA domain-containing protein [Herbaspirillum sp. SJZ107]|uniref:VWA domain-containing protein n=1 Tax=Herbaspirillum sp. SJZ107 TaxID=2572881 RepID=UPI00114DE864|nr:VWA domain-containing protein [Herbaspirillum sp. SJZ107]TQK06960.1 uncharacterized protein with von Willebrand factor type A (vWA) domain [Herbaspirillum sp. SJZ107]
MPLSPVDSASQEVSAAIGASYASVLDASPAVRRHVSEQMVEWERATKSALGAEFPLLSHERKLLHWQTELHSLDVPKSDLDQAVDDYLSFSRAIGRPANESFWRGQFGTGKHRTASRWKPAEETFIGARLLLAEWRKQLDGVRAEWELQEIASRRAALMEQLDRLLELLQKLRDQLHELGLDTGILLDLSKGSLTPQNIEQFKRWATYLAEDKGIRSLCDLLGKMRQIDLSERIERVASVVPTSIHVPDISSREEIVGIRLGRDIEHVLPSELALLADPDTALLFDLKYVESGLMCFDMQGIQRIHRHVETEEERRIQEAEQHGPMMICVDTSGSMNGTPETVAKAVTLFLAAKSREQKRPCYLINFSTGIDVLELGADVGLEAVLRFLQMSFHGGTDVAPALEHALDKMEEEAYRNADLLVISDFIMSALPERTLARIDGRRGHGNRFHSLVVGDCYMTQRLKSFFDNEWVYDPRYARIHELVSFQQDMNCKGQV